MNETYLSITQVNNYIKNIFEAEVMLQNICVFGEVSSYKISNNIAYFNLKDNSGLLPCVLFNANKFPEPNLGDMVLVVGSVNYYAKGGRLSFNAYQIAPYGRGLLYDNFLQLKESLEKQGYFDSSHKKEVPNRVNRIGVVSSATGAVIQDIIDVTTRRNKNVDIVLYPVKVQGIGAENEIAKGINFFSNYKNVDAVIVARGGGSLEDLQPFNTFMVAEATYKCNKPIISAVGHETDYTIIDFVADLRAPTPSAAAELVVNELIDDINFIDSNLNYMFDILIDRINTIKNNILYNLKTINNNVNFCVNTHVNTFNILATKLISNIDLKLNNTCNKYQIINNHLIMLNPKLPLTKGYTKVEKNGKAIKSCNDFDMNETYNLIFADGNKIIKGVKE